MISEYSASLKDINSDIPCATFNVNDNECIKKFKNCKGKTATIRKKVKLEPMEENLNAQFCIDSRQCSKCPRSNCTNDYNYNHGCFNDILLLILIFIIFRSICWQEPCEQFSNYYIYQ